MFKLKNVLIKISLQMFIGVTKCYICCNQNLFLAIIDFFLNHNQFLLVRMHSNQKKIITNNKNLEKIIKFNQFWPKINYDWNTYNKILIIF